jgi:hypothetical protein
MATSTEISSGIFPANPSNLEIIVTPKGETYQYSSVYRSWSHIVRPVVPLATPLSDGLMSAADLYKINNILLNPPKSTLSIPSGTVISSGYVDLVGDGYVNINVGPTNITENTALVEFSLDFDALAKRLVTNGNITFVTTAGDQGDQGPPGVAGRDSLSVGPRGLPGSDGANSAWPGALVQDNINVKADNRAIVDISTQEVSPTENYLIVTRANIGNPDACPDTIIPEDKQSPWMLGISPGATSSTTASAGAVSCSTSCNSVLYYFNVETIVDSVRTHTATYLDSQKTLKEAYVQQEIDKLSSVFEEQKAAIACALERCRSKYRNDDARKYLQTTKIAAASADPTKPAYKLNIQAIPPEFPNSAAFTPNWGKAGVTYDSITLADPEVPIINPDDLTTGPITDS